MLALVTVTLAAQTKPPVENPTDRIVALDPRWTVAFDTVPAAPPGYDQETAYVPLKATEPGSGGAEADATAKRSELVAIDLNQGDIKWRVALETPFTPATGDGLVFATEQGQVMALDQRAGQVLWRTSLDTPLAAPLYWDSGLLLASTEAGELAALGAEDGRILWRNALGSPLAVPPTPSGDRLYAALRDGRIVALDLATGAAAWSYPLNEPVTGMLALEDQLVIGTRSNVLHSMSLDRARIRWTQRAGADIAGAPVADDKLIFFAALDNVLRALDRRTGNLKWSRNLPSRPAGGPLRTTNLVLVPFMTTDIGAYTAATGVEAFTIHAVGEIAGIPYLRESDRPTAPRLIAMSREVRALQGFSQRFEPPPTSIAELPGTKVGGH